MLKKQVREIGLLLIMFLLPLTAFGAEMANGVNCDNGVCTLSDHQDNTNDQSADAGQNK